MPALPCTCVTAVLIRMNEAGAVALEVIDIKYTTSYRLGHKRTTSTAKNTLKCVDRTNLHS